MGYLLKEGLKTICGVNQWSYAVFWKIGLQNPELLIWEECYYEPVYAGLPQISGIENPELALDEWEACWVSAEARTSRLGVQAGNNVHSLVNKMMMDNHVNIVGKGLVGRAALTGNHLWILSENYTREVHPPEVLNEVSQQFSAGMQTVVVIPVLPHGVVQLGSSLTIMENIGFVSHVKALVLQLGCVPGALLSDSYATKEPPPKTGFPLKSVPVELPGRAKVTDSTTFIADSFRQQSNSAPPSGLVGQISYSVTTQFQDNSRSTGSIVHTPNMVQNSVRSNDSVCLAKVIPSNPDVWLNQKDSSYRQPSGGQPTATYGSLRSLEHHFLSDTVSGDYANDSISASNGFLISQQKTVGGLASSTQKNFVTAPLHELSESHKASFPLVFGGGPQNVESFRTDASTYGFADHLTTNHLLSVSNDRHLDEKSTQKLAEGKERVESDLFQACGYQSSSLTNAKYEDLSTQPRSGDDLFDIFGVDLKNKILNGSWNKFINNGLDTNTDTNTKSLDKITCGPTKLQDSGSDFYSVNEGNSDSGIFSVSASDHLLDAVVSKAHSASKSSEDNLSCRTTVTKMSGSSAPIVSPPSSRANVLQAELLGMPRSLTKAGALGPCSIRSGPLKEDARNFSPANSIYGSQISSWVEQDKDMKRNTSVSSAFSKKADETNKSNRKRLKPGENPRPRPKDRQMIQDRVKELREIVPNGAKCSIDALLERTIKHMLFLQSVTKHADKLRQTGDSKIISKEGGLLLKDNTEGGATWAYEVGSQSMVCPIIVEDLNPPRQMLVEMLCEERGLFLEIADIIRGLGLTILKGVMENRNDKIWARFAVEANRDVTRMEIFLSLVRLLEQTVKSGTLPANCMDNDNMMVHQAFHQTPSIPATGRPCSM
ncbi:hypothetical protein LguiB_001258 [Lonicera macranthoides]